MSFRYRPAVVRYGAAVFLAVAAQLARLPIHPPTLLPFITYVPLLVLAAGFGGLGPGLVATGLCALEALYFAVEPLGKLATADPQHWVGLGALAFAGVATSVLFEQWMRAREADQSTQRQLAEEREALRAAYAELSTIHANAPVMLLVVDDRLRVEKVNQLAASFAGKSFADLSGCRVGEAINCLTALTDPGGCGKGPTCPDCLLRLAILDTLRNGARRDRFEAWIQNSAGSDGVQRRCILVSTAPVETGQQRKALICAKDITHLKQVESDLRQTIRELESALTEKTVLLQEVHHRVKNNLAVISSMLALNADSTEHPEAKAVLEETRQRVHSIALIHEQLYGSDHLDRIDFPHYAQELIQRLYTISVGEPGRIAIRIEAETMELTVDRAVPCALILNELLVNVFKHAFPGARRGEVQIAFRSAGEWLELTVEDNGVGIPEGVEGPNPNSLGLRIIRILAGQLGGTLVHEPVAGTRTVLRFPAQ